MSRLGLNGGTAFSDTVTSAPLRGFRPTRASRFLTAKPPKLQAFAVEIQPKD